MDDETFSRRCGEILKAIQEAEANRLVPIPDDASKFLTWLHLEGLMQVEKHYLVSFKTKTDLFSLVRNLYNNYARDPKVGGNLPSLNEIEEMMGRALCQDPVGLQRLRNVNNLPHKFMQSICDYYKTARSAPIPVEDTALGAYPRVVEEYLKKRRALNQRSDAAEIAVGNVLELGPNVQGLSEDLMSWKRDYWLNANEWADPVRFAGQTDKIPRNGGGFLGTALEVDWFSRGEPYAFPLAILTPTYEDYDE
jgi:hypothetical protein